ncbi:hypothetical protein JCM18237_09170 [Halorubrum luteum]
MYCSTAEREDDSTTVRSQPVVVQEDSHQNEIPENIDSDLYSADTPPNPFHEFMISGVRFAVDGW